MVAALPTVLPQRSPRTKASLLDMLLSRTCPASPIGGGVSTGARTLLFPIGRFFLSTGSPPKGEMSSYTFLHILCRSQTTRSRCVRVVTSASLRGIYVAQACRSMRHAKCVVLFAIGIGAEAHRSEIEDFKP